MRKILTTAAVTALAALSLTTAASGAFSSGPTPPDPSVQPPPEIKGRRAVAPLVTEDEHVKLTPCRIVDTRAAGGAIAGGTTRNFHVRGTGGFPGQGGKAGGCGVPQSATAVVAAITAVNPTGTGYLRAWPYLAPEPNTTLINYTGGASITNSTDLTLGGGAAAITVKPSTTSHVVIDVLGYYIPPIQASIAYNGPVYAGGSRVLSSVRTSPGAYQITVDRDLTGCSAEATTWPANNNAGAYVSGNKVFGFTADGANTPTDFYWSFVVHC